MFPSSKKEVSGALVLAAGLVVGGVLTLAGRHLDLRAPGLLASAPLKSQVATALSPAERGPEGPLPEALNGSAPGETRAGTAVSDETSYTRVDGRDRRLAAIDMNSASAKELEALDGVGPSLAAKIVRLRDSKGGCFRSMEELLEVRGIGPATLARIMASATIVSPDAETQKNALRKSTSSQVDSSSFQR